MLTHILKKAIKLKTILLNCKEATEEKILVSLFDTISIVPSKKYYKLVLSEKGKFGLKEIKENESTKKVSKIINKKMIKGKKIQVNLMDGRNILSDVKGKVNDSIIFSFKENKIEKIIPLEEGANALVFAGKHSGEIGIVNKIIGEKRMVEMNMDGKPTKVLIKQLIVIEK